MSFFKNNIYNIDFRNVLDFGKMMKSTFLNRIAFTKSIFYWEFTPVLI